MKNTRIKDSLRERLYWFIKLRWIAVTGVPLTVLTVTQVFGLPLNVFPIYLITFLLGLCNLAYLVFLNQSDKRDNQIANLQIFLDLSFLTTLIHFSGGIENPFIFYFIFHMIIASILLTRRASFLQASVAVFMLSFITVLEYKGILPHYCLKGFVPVSMHRNFLYIFGELFVFTSTLYIAVYMATSISMRLRERERSLEKANLLLEEKDRIKSEYVLRVTHNIKEHLSAVKSCIEPVTKGITGPLNEKQKNMLFRARDRADKLLFFVRALLEITRIKLDKGLKMDVFSFPGAMRAIIEDISARAKAKGISFNADIESSIGNIRGVRVYIEEAISNLLANSLKYTSKGGNISLQVLDRGETVFIEIKDSGIGIPEDDIPHIFDEFHRAGNAKAIEKMGTGLGLAITKKIIELHKGKISLESVEGKGTIFYIELLK